ncbi:hypothetical protein AKJ09_05502 [Labilithrix luteola]|uniref:Uncharacterized protein n=2 Tax=Labilithrix luteola TaxID=1391654 RepID=A0A0K1PZ88_9BACT|nr:hypothetical protein AKJ09_05502 [Labilithrix luteola]
MDDESANATSTRIASDIDEHHGEFAHDPPWSEIHVYGTPLSHELEQVFRELGATEFEPTKDGFISRR